MAQDTHLGNLDAQKAAEQAALPSPEFESLAKNAHEISQVLAWNPGVLTSRYFSTRWKAMCAGLRPVLEKVARTRRKEGESDDLRWLRENTSLLWTALWNTRNAFK